MDTSNYYVGGVKCEPLLTTNTTVTSIIDNSDCNGLHDNDTSDDDNINSSDDAADIELFILELDIYDKSNEAKMLINLQNALYQKYLITDRLTYLSACNGVRREAYTALAELGEMEVRCQRREDLLWLMREKTRVTMPLLMSTATQTFADEMMADLGIGILSTRDVGTTATPSDIEEQMDITVD